MKCCLPYWVIITLISHTDRCTMKHRTTSTEGRKLPKSANSSHKCVLRTRGISLNAT